MYWRRFLCLVVPRVSLLCDPESLIIVVDAISLIMHSILGGVEKVCSIAFFDIYFYWAFHLNHGFRVQGSSRDGLTGSDGRVLLELFGPALFHVALLDTNG